MIILFPDTRITWQNYWYVICFENVTDFIKNYEFSLEIFLHLRYEMGNSIFLNSKDFSDTMHSHFTL